MFSGTFGLGIFPDHEFLLQVELDFANLVPGPAALAD
jgi:hypothetical protein